MRRVSFFLIMLMMLSCTAKAEETINCRAKHTLYHNDFVVSAFYHFLFYKSNGTIMFNGKITDGNTHFIVSRNIHFDYTAANGRYKAVSREISKIPADNTPDDVLQKHFPSFFINEGAVLMFNVHRVNKNAHIISFVSIPIFYCYE